LQYWTGVVKKLFDDKKLKMGVAAANNHFAGSAPLTTNMFRNMLGQLEVEFGDKVPFKPEKQAAISDFYS
jgi:hypothetical protein